MTTIITIAVILAYIAGGIWTASTLKTNIDLLHKAGERGTYSLDTEPMVFGGVLWPVLGAAMLYMHRFHYGITSGDRKLLRAGNSQDLHRVMEKWRQEQVRKMERDLGIGD